MEFPIKRDQLQSGDAFRQQIEIEEQRKFYEDKLEIENEKIINKNSSK